jgi:DNA-directed RNA polymerase subunit RPC12/RpoP
MPNNKIKDSEYQCAWCGGVFEFVRDETWNEEKANKEYKELFPSESMKNRDIVCDDCWQIVKPE